MTWKAQNDMGRAKRPQGDMTHAQYQAWKYRKTLDAITGAAWDCTGTVSNDGTFYRGTINLHWTEGADRFHIWFDARTGKQQGATAEEPNDGCIYKNCAVTLKRGEPGHYETRQLDATQAVNVARIAKARELAGTQNAAWMRKERDEKAERVTEDRAARVSTARAHIEAAGVAILVALDLLLANPADAGYLDDARTVLDMHRADLETINNQGWTAQAAPVTVADVFDDLSAHFKAGA